jgi:hypothetical protein
VTVSWAYLEHAILDDCTRMALLRNIKLPDDAFKVALKPRLRVWREMIIKYRRGKPREQLLKVISRVENAQKSRNQITHGLWSWEYHSAERVTAKSYKPKFEFTEPFGFKKLMKLAETLGEINFELQYPRGEKQAMKVLAARGQSMSRNFVRAATGKRDLSTRPITPEAQKRLAILAAKLGSFPKPVE